MRAFWLTLLVVAGLSFEARAFPVCEEGVDDARADDDLPEDDSEPERVILPCSLADAALEWGSPSCAEATFYVVSTTGSLLCQIDLPALAPSTLPALEQAPSTHLSTSSAFFAAGLAPPAASLPPPLVREIPGMRPAPVAVPRDGFARPPSVPS